MADAPIRFDDGAAYERMMGVWSRSAGEVFLDWVAPKPGQRWLDVGCGNGAFTALIAQRCAPAELHGVDPSAGQLAYAKTRPDRGPAQFREGQATALPFADNSVDAATMALVIFFVPEPAKGVAELARVVAPGGLAAAYAWDMPGGGFPFEPIFAPMRALGLAVAGPPSADASRSAALRDLWHGAGFQEVETRTIAVERRFQDFEEYWTIGSTGPGLGAAFAKMDPALVARIKSATEASLKPNADGALTCTARANAVKGRLPR